VPGEWGVLTFPSQVRQGVGCGQFGRGTATDWIAFLLQCAELFLCPALQITTVPLEDTNDLTCLSLQEDHDVVGKICSP